MGPTYTATLTQSAWGWLDLTLIQLEQEFIAIVVVSSEAQLAQLKQSLLLLHWDDPSCSSLRELLQELHKAEKFAPRLM